MNKKSKSFIFTGILLIFLSICLTGYNLTVSFLARNEAGDILEEISSYAVSETEAGETQAYPEYIRNPNMDMPVVTIGSREYIGYIDIPSLSLKLPVCSEWSNRNLRHSPCLYGGSVYLDTMIICAHNYISHFGRLRRLSPGDKVIFTDAAGNRFLYRATEFELLAPDAVEDMTDGNYGLTLFTCTPGGRTRVTLRCERDKQQSAF